MRILVLIASLLFFNSLAFTFDHEHKNFDLLLKEYVKFEGQQSLVNYKGFIKKKKQLQSYLDSLSKVTKSEYKDFTKDQKLTFLINVYNAFTIKLIIDNYPVKSIKDIGGIFSSPWKKKFFKLLGKKTSLDHVEHGMIRKQFNEPRIHFAVNCASIGCPALLDRAFTAEKLEQQLAQTEAIFLKDKNKNKYNAKKNELIISKIFKWYGGDFVKVHGSLKKYLANIMAQNKSQKEAILKDADIDYSDYDWNLNELK